MSLEQLELGVQVFTGVDPIVVDTDHLVDPQIRGFGEDGVLEFVLPMVSAALAIPSRQ